MRRSSCYLALACAWIALTACTTDASLTKDVVGTWTWKPSKQLPEEKVSKAGFVTPDLEAVQFGADGHFVFVQSLPGYDTSVGGTIVHVPDYWTECHGSWSVASGELSLEESPGDKWAARHESKGWLPEDTRALGCKMFSYKIIEHQQHRLQLQAIAIGDYDRAFERSSAMPDRPVLSKP
jgi:hypothetical protein